MNIDYIVTGSKNDFEQYKIYKLDLIYWAITGIICIMGMI